MHWPWKQLVIQHYQFITQLMYKSNSYHCFGVITQCIWLVLREGDLNCSHLVCWAACLPTPSQNNKHREWILCVTCIGMYQPMWWYRLKQKMSIYPNLNLKLALSHPSTSILKKNTARTSCAQLAQDIYPVNEQMCVRTKTTHTFLSSKWNF